MIAIAENSLMSLTAKNPVLELMTHHTIPEL
jgi:hypothetical protein